MPFCVCGRAQALFSNLSMRRRLPFGEQNKSRLCPGEVGEAGYSSKSRVFFFFTFFFPELSSNKGIYFIKL